MPTASLWAPGKILHYHASNEKLYGEILILGIKDNEDIVVLILTNPFTNSCWTAQQGASYEWAASDESSRVYHFAEECASWSFT